MEVTIIQKKIYELHGHKVMFDFDLAELYGVETKVLNQAVKRNLDRFPDDFMFQLTHGEWMAQRSQFVTFDARRPKYTKYQPFVFTEHGVAMLASVLRSEVAIKMNIAIVRAFIAMRELAMPYKELADQIKKLEEKYDRQFASVYEVLKVLMEEKDARGDFEKREMIGFRRNID